MRGQHVSHVCCCLQPVAAGTAPGDYRQRVTSEARQVGRYPMPVPVVVLERRKILPWIAGIFDSLL
jgi:hypothetical protein